MTRLTVIVCALVLSVPGLASDYTFLPALSADQGQDMPLLDIALCDSRLLAVGERGLVVYSDDMGETWLQADVPVSQTLTAVYCLPSGEAWAVGHSASILASVDRGETWSSQFDGYDANRQWLDYARVEKESLEKKVAVAEEADLADLEYALEDAIFAIEDALEASETGPADPFLDVWFSNDRQGYAVGAYGMIYRTEDGGKNWLLSVLGIENLERYHYYSITANNAGVMFLSGEAGLLYRSVDQGENWTRLNAGYDGSLFGLVITHEQSVLTFGLRGNIFRSEDDGDTWLSVEVEKNPRLSLYGGTRLGDDSIALVGAGGGILTSVNGGRVFQGRIMLSRNTLSAIVGSELSRAQAVGMGGVDKPYGDDQ
ncbi:MAG: YCF48-related protein [Halioglobus sp.]